MKSLASTVLTALILTSTCSLAQSLPPEIYLVLNGQARSTEVVMADEGGHKLEPFNLRSTLEESIKTYLRDEHQVQEVRIAPNIAAARDGLILAVSVNDLDYFRAHWENFQVPGRIKLTILKPGGDRIEEGFNLNVNSTYEHSMFFGSRNAQLLREAIPAAIAKKVNQKIDELLTSADATAFLQNQQVPGNVIVRRNDSDRNLVQVNPGSSGSSAVYGQAILGAVGALTAQMQQDAAARAARQSPVGPGTLVIREQIPSVPLDENSGSGYATQSPKIENSPQQSAGIPNANQTTVAQSPQTILSFRVTREGIAPPRPGRLGNEYLIEILNEGNVPIRCTGGVEYEYLSSGQPRRGSDRIFLTIPPKTTATHVTAHRDDIIQGRPFPTNIINYKRNNLRCNRA